MSNVMEWDSWDEAAERLAARRIEELKGRLHRVVGALRYARNLIGPDEIIDAALAINDALTND